jgi:hypothetical protein
MLFSYFPNKVFKDALKCRCVCYTAYSNHVLYLGNLNILLVSARYESYVTFHVLLFLSMSFFLLWMKEKARYSNFQCSDKREGSDCVYQEKRQSSPITGLDRPLSSRRLRLPEFLDSRHMKVLRLSTLRTSRLYPSGNIPVLISLRG